MCAEICADRSVSLQLSTAVRGETMPRDEEQCLDGVVDTAEVGRLHVDDVRRFRGDEDLDVFEGIAPLVDRDPDIAASISERGAQRCRHADLRGAAAGVDDVLDADAEGTRGIAETHEIRGDGSTSPPNATPMVP